MREEKRGEETRREEGGKNKKLHKCEVTGVLSILLEGITVQCNVKNAILFEITPAEIHINREPVSFSLSPFLSCPAQLSCTMYEL